MSRLERWLDDAERAERQAGQSRAFPYWALPVGIACCVVLAALTR